MSAIPKVFLSSTSKDLKPHRAVAMDAIRAAGGLAVVMEDFEARSDNAPMQHCLDKVSESELVIVLVAHRYGWVPPDQPGDFKKSITWLECEHAASLDKEVLALVVDDAAEWPMDAREEGDLMAAVQAGTGTSKQLKEVQTRIANLKQFKAWLDERGIRVTFASPEEVKTRVLHAVQSWMNRRSGSSDGAASSEMQMPPVIPEGYRQWLMHDCGDVDLLGLELKQGHAVRLSNVYVPLGTPGMEIAINPIKTGEKVLGTFRTERERRISLLTALNSNSRYVPGIPGSGKSTFSRWVALIVAAGEMLDHPIATPEELAEPFPDALRNRLPLLLRLRDFWRWLPANNGCRSLSQAELEAAMQRWITDTHPGGLQWDDVASHLEHGLALLIFDGVDEVPQSLGEDANGCSPRRMLLSGLADAIPNWTSNNNRVLVTSRPYGISESERHKLGLQHSPVNELDEPSQDLLVRRWFHTLIEDASKAAETADSMISHIRGREALSQLVTNPMLLTAMCVIYGQGKRLPQNKHELYDRILDNVLYNRYPNDKPLIDMVRNRLSVVAYGMHTGFGLGEERDTPQAQVTHDEIDKVLRIYKETKIWSEDDDRSVVETRDQLLLNTGLLLPRDEKQAGFYHLSFQEFLAAQKVLDLQDDSAGMERLIDTFHQRAAVPEWHNTLSFLFGRLVAASVSPERGVRLLGHLLDGLTLDELGLCVVVADCLQILKGRRVSLQPSVEDQFRALCLQAFEQEVPVRERQQLGLALGVVGDPRVVVDLRDRSAYVEIPAGEYRIGDSGAYSSLDEQVVRIDAPYLLSRFPVTNSQFGLFVSEGGYANEALWNEAGWKWRVESDVREPRFWQNSKWNGLNQPVVGVCWYEAEAFCNWAGGCLPSDVQWEAAARGSEGLLWPWGDEWQNGRCN